jgi:phosphotriesterase-related protein
VNTVLGPVPAEELGLVAVHEHIGYGMPGSELDTTWWKTPEERYEETVPKLRRFHQHGGGTFVDATGICNGRDVDYYQSLSAKTGVHIVASTGFVGGDTALPFFARAGVEYLAAQFVHEITVGIGRTGGCAGVIKVGVSRGGRMTSASTAQPPVPPWPRACRSSPTSRSTPRTRSPSSTRRASRSTGSCSGTPTTV